MSRLFRFFAQRDLFAWLITLGIILLGLASLASIKRDNFPQVEFGEVFINTTYPGASSEDVELKVTNRIEDELKGVSGIKEFDSWSFENVSIIHVVVEPDEADQDQVIDDIREAVNRVRDLPEEITESPQILELKTSVFPVIEVGLAGDLPYRELRELARLAEKRLKLVPGVSRLDRFGYRDREIKVEIFPEAVRKYEIPLREIIQAIRHRNVRATGGTFESYTSEKNIVTLAQFRDPREVEDVVVRGSFDGPLVKIRDLGIVRDDFEDARVLSRMNGRSAISFVIYKTSGADILRTVGAVKDLVDREKHRLPEGVDILYSNDESGYVTTRLNTVLTNGAVGLVLVFLVLTLFLSARIALWVALGIPVALLGTLFVIPWFGGFLDSISLTAMILVIGIVVDDAIIISENIYRRFELGETPLNAAVHGVSEVFPPVLTTVLTTFVAFAPMFFMPGIMGKFVYVIPLVVTVALFFTLIESTLALPAHLVPGLKRRPGGGTNRRQRNFDRFRTAFQRFLRSALRFRYAVTGLFILIMAATIAYAVLRMDFVLFPSTAADRFMVLVETPTGSSLQATSKRVAEIERAIDELGEEELASYLTRIGLKGETVLQQRENYAMLVINLTPFNKRERTADEIVEALRKKTDALEGFRSIRYLIDAGGPPVGRPITIRIVGSDGATRKRLADDVMRFLKATDGVRDLDRDDKAGKEQIELKIDYEKLARSGISVADIARTVRIAYDGEVVTSVRYGEEDVDFRVVFPPQARQGLSYLENLLVPNRDNQLVYLKQVATPVMGVGQGTFRHYDGERAIQITGDVDKEKITPVQVTDAVRGQFDLDRDYTGMRFVIGGEAEETQRSVNDLIVTFALAGLGIYFLLVILFNSLGQPFIVMFSVPFGIVGVIIAFALHGEPFGFLAMIGLIGLAGVVVNDALVLVDRVNKLRIAEPDTSVLDIVARGSADRLRAITLTSVSTIAGLLPLAYGIGGTDPYMSPMALALGYGLLFATPLTLVLVPCLYVIGADLGRLVSRRRVSN